jgi:hypothetical protein
MWGKPKRRFIMKFVTPGTIAAVLAIAAGLAGQFGQAGLAHFFADPSTSQSVLTMISSALTLYAGIAVGVKHS